MTDSWGHRRVLVTGATGIVGSWLVKELFDLDAFVVPLIRDWDPQSELIRSRAVDRCNVVNGALEDYAAVERAISHHEIDTVFHLGAQTIVGTALRSPLGTFEANIRGTYNLLDACRVHRGLVKRIVIASSDKAYGESPVLPYVESMAVNGRHPYDVSKSCTDLLAMTYAHTYGLPVTVARCGNIYGGGDLNWSRLIPGTIRSLHNDERPVLRSDGKYTRDFVFVRDIVRAYLLLAENAAAAGVRGEAFNFSPETRVTPLEITSLISTIMGRRDLDPIILDNAEAEIRDQSLDSSKARRVLNWAPAYTLSDGLTETVEWYQQYFHARSWVPVANPVA